MNISNSRPFQSNGVNGHAVPQEEIEFLDVVNINDLICYLSKKLMLDPVQLDVCGHNFSRAEMGKWYLQKKAKVCPIPSCSKSYTSMKDNSFLKEMVRFCINKYDSNQQIAPQLYQLYDAIPESSDKQKIKEAIDLFLKSSKEEAVAIVTDIILSVTDDVLYVPILDLMRAHSNPASNKKENLGQQIDQPTSQDNISEYYTKQLKGLKFLNVVKINDLICSYSKELMFEPAQLIPCGHYASRETLRARWIVHKKTCPVSTCAQPYNSTVENLFLKKIVDSFFKIQNQPDQYLRTQLLELWDALPLSQEKQKIKAALDLFFKGSLKKANAIVLDIILAHSNDHLYAPIIQLMMDHTNNVENKKERLIQQSNSLVLSNSLPLSASGPTIEKLPTFLEGRVEIPHPINLPRIWSNPPPVTFINSSNINPEVPVVSPLSTANALNVLAPMNIDNISQAFLLRNDEVQMITQSAQTELPSPKASSSSPKSKSKKRSAEDSSDTFYQPVAERLRKKKRTETETPHNNMTSDEGVDDQELSAETERMELQDNSSSQTEEHQASDDVFIAEALLPSSSNTKSSKTIKLKFKATSNPAIRDEGAIEKVQSTKNSQLLDTPEKRLIHALKNQHKSNTYQHIKKVKDINIQDDEGNGPLHLVVLNYKKTENYIKTFVNHKIQIDAQNGDGNTALHLAAKKGKIKTIKQLRAHNASTNIPNNKGKLPIDLAKSDAVKKALS